jgi:glycosyltransferase involved in cell wall biosynthesis
MKSSSDGGDGRPTWAINGRFMTQRITGVQRYAYEIVASLDEISSEDGDVARRLGLRLVMPPGADARLALPQIDVCQTKFGSGHGWDQLILPWYGTSGVLSLGNFGPVLARHHIVCIHDANSFIEPDSYSRAFGLAYRTSLPLIGGQASRVATVSQFSADMLVKYGICRREKIFIAPNGHEHALRWDAKRAEIPPLKVLRCPYVLLLGSSAKRKNVHVILEEARGLDAAGIDIVVVGGASSIFSANAPDYQRANIPHAGYVGDDELTAEGFGSAAGGNDQGLPRHLLECSKSHRGGRQCGHLCGSRPRRWLAGRDHWPCRKPGSSRDHGGAGPKESGAVLLETQRAALSR